MIRPQTFGTLLALGALTVLPACSMFGGGQQGASSYQQSRATTRSPARTASQTAENTAPPVVSNSMMRKIQANLKHDGLYRGRVDGVWGPMTEHAVMSYQQQHGLQSTGKLDLPTLQAMNEMGGNSQYNEASGSGGNAAGNAGSNGESGNMNASAGQTAPAGNSPNYATGPSRATGGAYQSAGNPNSNGTTTPANQGSGSANMGNGQGTGSNTGR